jgi:hypothetical protein
MDERDLSEKTTNLSKFVAFELTKVHLFTDEAIFLIVRSLVVGRWSLVVGRWFAVDCPYF